MATGTLTSTNPAATYKLLLKVAGTQDPALDDTLRIIEDGDGNNSSLKLTHTGNTYGASFVGRVGIGTDTPDYLLDVEGTGAQTMRIYSSDDDAALYISSAADESEVSKLVFAADTFVAGQIFYNHNTTAADQNMRFYAGDNALAMGIEGTGKVGIGAVAAAPGAMLHVSDNTEDDFACEIKNTHAGGYGLEVRAGGTTGDIVFKCADKDGNQKFKVQYDGNLYADNLAAGAGNYPVEYTTSGGQISQDTSDVRLKKDIISYNSDALSIVADLKVRNFYWKSENVVKNEMPEVNYSCLSETEQQIGFIAQEVNEVIPNFSTLSQQDLYGINYKKFIPYLVKAIQELAAEVEQLKNA